LSGCDEHRGRCPAALRLACGVAAAVLGGCLAAPVPLPAHQVVQYGHRRFEASLPAVESRRDLVLRLGEPDIVGMDERWTGYITDKARGRWIGINFVAAVIAGSVLIDAPWGEREVLVVTFGPDGAVTGHRVHRVGLRPGWSELKCRASAWAREIDPSIPAGAS
jgi:hypothetical protein